MWLIFVACAVDSSIILIGKQGRHVQEEFFPCSVQWFFERAELVSWELMNKVVNIRKLLGTSEMTAERVASVHLFPALSLLVQRPLLLTTVPS
jgi:hypothetical protein